MRMQNWLVTAGVAAALCFGVSNSLAQGGGGGGGRQRGGRGGNMDPAQFQQMMMDNVKQTLEVNNDDEWKVLEPLVQKVMDARQQVGNPGRGMFMGRGGRGGRGGGDNPGGDQGNQPQRRGGFGQNASPEAEALQRAIDAKASKAELKAALNKYVEARKTKQDQLKAAQEDLRKVLTARQEAIATVGGLL